MNNSRKLEKCSNCMDFHNEYFSLDCRHPFCVSCLSQNLLQFEEETTLKDYIEIVCSTCNFITELPITLAYKISRSCKKMKEAQYLHQSKLLICLQCFNECFTLDQYLLGKHQKHQVKSIDQAIPIITDIFMLTSQKLQDNIQDLYRESDKLCQRKKLLNDILNANVIKIKLGFEHLKDTINSKQIQILNQYELMTIQKFRILDDGISIIGQQIDKHSYYSEWIFNHIAQDGIEKHIEILNFYIQNHEKIDQILNISHCRQFNDLKNKATTSLHQSNNQQGITMIEIQSLVRRIRQINVFNMGNNHLQEKSVPFDSQYFDTKRKQVLAKNNENLELQNDEYLRTFYKQKIQSNNIINKILGMKKTIKNDSLVKKRYLKNILSYE